MRDTATPPRDARFRDLGLLAMSPLWLAGALVAWHALSFYTSHGTFGIDAHAYWLTHSRTDLYGLPPGAPNAYLYTPAFAQAVYPITALPFRAFQLGWGLLELTAYSWLFKPLGWRVAVPMVLFCSVELGLGNIYPLLAVCAVVGLRRPWLWALPLLTKVTPGVGLVWFAVRREWRRLAIAVGATAIVIVVSLAFDRNDWSAWFRYTSGHSGDSQLFFPIRLATAIALVAVGGLRNRAALLGPALLLACPVFQDVSPLTMLAVLPRLLDRDRASRVEQASTSTSPPLTPTGAATGSRITTRVSSSPDTTSPRSSTTS